MTTTNLPFADDIDAIAGQKEELFKLVNQLDKAPTTYGMEISAEKTKLKIPTTPEESTQTLELVAKNLETVQRFKY